MSTPEHTRPTEAAYEARGRSPQDPPEQERPHPAESRRIALAILEQLGGARFLAMTGARNLVAIGNGLRFRLPRNFARDRINRITITLDPSDTYTLLAERVDRGGIEGTILHEASGLYDDMLAGAFTEATGLDTRL